MVRTGRIGQSAEYELGSGSYVRTGVGRTYVREDVRQGKEESARETLTKIVVWDALTSRHQASGLPSLSGHRGEGVQDVFIPTHLPKVVLSHFFVFCDNLDAVAKTT